MSGIFAGWTRESVNSLTDAVGIVAVLLGLFGLLFLDVRGASGRGVPRRWKAGAMVIVGFSVLVIGGRFQVLPDTPTEAATSATSTSTTTAVPDEAGDPDEVAGGPSTTAEPDDDDTTSTTVVGPPAPPTTEEGPADDPAPPPVADDESPPVVDDGSGGPRGPPADGSSYTVEDGDNFWALAASTLEAESDGPVSNADIATYWQSLIDANADQLVQPGNADLIVPGQVLELPPTTALPTTT